MDPNTVILIGVGILSNVTCFFFGALWGRETVLKVRREYESTNPKK